MANIQIKNFARSTLAIGAAPAATTLTLAASTGSLFPALSGAQYFYLTLENSSLSREIVKVTARSGDNLTVVRGQDGTSALTWNAGDIAALRLNAAAIEDSVLNAVQSTGSTGSAVLPVGTTAERDGSPTTGYLRFNSSTGQFEGYGATGWGSIGGGAVANETLLETKHTISTNYTLTTGASAVTVGPLSVATGQSLTVPTGEAVVALSTTGTPAADNVTPITTGTQTVYGNKTFTGQITFTGGVAWNASATPSMVRLNTANGYGSTSTRYRRFTNVVTNQGSDITYADSATLGATFTIVTAGVYAVSYSDQFSAGEKVQISVGDTAPTGAPNVGELLAGGQTVGAGANACAAWTGFLAAGSVIRARTESGTSTGTDTKACQFTITRVA